MDIHKPKPWHGLREFLKEYLIIVIGVLTALAAEQGVEWLRWQEKLVWAEEALKRDQSLLADVASERVAVGHCLSDRLDQLKARAEDDRLRASPLPADAEGVQMGFAYSAPSRAWNTRVWDQMMADGTVQHMDRERARALSLLYLTVQSANVGNHEEKNEATDLRVLADGKLSLSPDKKVELVQHIDRLTMLNSELVSLSRQILRRLQDNGYLPPLAETTARLSTSSGFHPMSCRYAAEDLKARVAQSWFSLHR